MTIIELINQLMQAAIVLGNDAEVRLRPAEEWVGTRDVAKVKLIGLSVSAVAVICEDLQS